VKIKLRLPRWFLGWVGMSLTLTVGILFYMSGLWAYFGISPSPGPVIWPDAGVYSTPSLVGLPNEDQSQTVRLNLAGGRMNRMHFENMDLGQAGLDDAIRIQDGTPSTTTTETYLECETVTFENVEAPTFNLGNAEIYRINATSSVQVSGHTISPTLDTSIGDITVGSVRGAGEYIVDPDVGKVADRIIIDVGTGNVPCVSLVFKDIRIHTGGINLDNLRAGTLNLINLKIGQGDIDSPDFIIATSTKYAILNDGITDAGVAVK